MAKKTTIKTVEDTKRYADPTTGTYIDLTKNLPKAVEESVARPDTVEDTTNDELNRTYPWCVAALTTPQRAILCELIRIRKALEAK